MPNENENPIFIDGISLKEGGGKFFSIRFSGKAKEFIKQIEENENEKGYFNFEIKQRKEVSKYGDTHYMVVNTYKPD